MASVYNTAKVSIKWHVERSYCTMVMAFDLSLFRWQLQRRLPLKEIYTHTHTHRHTFVISVFNTLYIIFYLLSLYSKALEGDMDGVTERERGGGEEERERERVNYA